MKTVFADAFYFVALLNRADQHHAKVIGFARQLRDDVLTTEWVLAEFADALAASSAHSLVPQFVHELERDPKVKIISADGDLFRRGLERYAERPDKQWSLTDCVSFV